MVDNNLIFVKINEAFIINNDIVIKKENKSKIIIKNILYIIGLIIFIILCLCIGPLLLIIYYINMNCDNRKKNEIKFINSLTVSIIITSIFWFSLFKLNII